MTTTNNKSFEQKLVILFGRYVVSEYYGSEKWDGQKCYLLADKDAVDRLIWHLQYRYKFLYTQGRLSKWVACKRAKEIYNFSVCGFKLKVWKRYYKQTGYFTLDTYKR